MIGPKQRLSGGCLCGAVRYRVTGPPHSVAYCHCRMCQRASGAPVLNWASFAAAQVEITDGTLQLFRSSPKAQRGFCRECGTPMMFRYRSGGIDWADITVASFDDPGRLPPQAHIWTASQVPWLELADGLPRHADSGPDLEPE